MTDTPRSPEFREWFEKNVEDPFSAAGILDTMHEDLKLTPAEQKMRAAMTQSRKSTQLPTLEPMEPGPMLEEGLLKAAGIGAIGLVVACAAMAMVVAILGLPLWFAWEKMYGKNLPPDDSY